MATEKRLIDASALIDEIDGIYQRHYVKSSYQFIHDFFRAVFRRIHKAPTVDAVEVVRGRWEWITDDIYKCTNCGEKSHVKEVMGKPDYHYCPNCGAKMDGERKDNA